MTTQTRLGILCLASMPQLGCYVTEPNRACVAGGEEGKAYRVTLLEELKEGTTDVAYRADINRGKPSCNGLDSLGVGGVLPIRIRADRDTAGNMACWVNSSEVELSTDVQVRAEANRKASLALNLLTWFTKTVTIGNCKGTLELLFIAAGPGDVFAERDPERFPPFVVDRHFYTNAAENCPQLGELTGTATCEDTWVADIQPE
ncbi:MAG: hypothetical protein QM784_09780 [Polyangiaceae bacterium]